MIDWVQQNLAALLQVIMIDVVLAADNAIIVGLAASRVAPELRQKVIFWGIAGAVALRVVFAALTTYLLGIVGLLLAGGLLLLVGVLEDVLGADARRRQAGGRPRRAGATGQPAGLPMSFGAAVTQIVVADVSMSLDNVLAVAGVAKGDPWVLIVGLGIAILLMAVAANAIANLLARFPVDRLDRLGRDPLRCPRHDLCRLAQVACGPGRGITCPPDMGELGPRSARAVT